MSKWNHFCIVFFFSPEWDWPSPLSYSSNYGEFQCPQILISPLPSGGRVRGEQEGRNLMHLHKTERDELQEMYWPLYWAMSAGNRSFSTEHFRPLVLLGEEEIRGETSHIPLPFLSLNVAPVAENVRGRGLSISKASEQCLWMSQIILSGWVKKII